MLIHIHVIVCIPNGSVCNITLYKLRRYEKIKRKNKQMVLYIFFFPNRYKGGEKRKSPGYYYISTQYVRFYDVKTRRKVHTTHAPKRLTARWYIYIV